MLKKYYDYLNKIQEMRNGKKEIETDYNFRDYFHTLFNNAMTKEERDAVHETFKIKQAERDAIKKHNANIDEIIKYMNNNAKHILFNCVIDTLTAELNAVKNKRFGEKTKQAFKESIKNKLHCVAYLNGDVLTVYTLNADGYTDGASATINIYCDGGFWDGDKLKTFTRDMFKLTNVKPYTHDAEIKTAIQDRETVLQAIKEHETKINELISKYNDLLPNLNNKISHIYIRF